MRLVDEEIVQLFVVHAESAAIQPDQEGGLRPHGLDAWKILFTETDDEVDVVLQIGDHVTPPLFAVFEGGERDDRREHGRFTELVHFQPCEEFSTKRVIGHDGVCTDNACDIEGLRGGRERDAVVGGSFRDGGERNVLVVP